MGCKRKRVEDVRFVQGKGNYVDDLKLPGMLYGDFVRSPHAHARIKNDRHLASAKAVPGVVAVLTADDLKPLNLHWMPTLAGDVQAVLADGQGAVPEPGGRLRHRRATATSRPTRPIWSRSNTRSCRSSSIRSRRWLPDAPVLREDLEGKTDGAHGKRKHHNHIFTWEIGDKAATDAAFEQGRGDDQGADLLSARASLPARDLPMRRLLRQDQGRADGLGHVPGAARHPHRRLADLEDPRAQDPRHRARHRRRLRQQGRRLFRLHLRHRRLDRDRPAGEMGRGPHREPLDHGVRARLPHDRRRSPRPRTARSRACACYTHRRPRRVRCLRRPDQVAGRLLQHRAPAPTTSRPRMCSVDGVYTNKAPGGVAYRCSFRVTEAAYCIERAMDILAQKLGMDPAELRMKNLIRREQFPYTSALGWEYDSGDYHTALHKAMEAVGYKQAARGAEGEAGGLQARRDARADGHRRRLLHRDRRRRAVAQLRHPRHRHVRLLRDPHPSHRHRHRPARHQVAGPGPRDDLRPDHRHRARACPPTTSRSRRATPTPRPTGSAPTARARRRSSGAATAMACRKIKAKAQMIAAHLLEVHDDDLEWDVDRFRVKGNPERFKTMNELAWAAYQRRAARHGARARGGRTTTIRPT